MTLRRLIVCAGMMACTISLLGTLRPCCAVENAAPAETKEQRDIRMKWWREARFGMFIHWGLYSIPAGSWNGTKYDGFGQLGEWIMLWAHAPVREYAKLADQFNPTKFNAEEWVLTAKRAGMKYIVITTKHHEGFAMYHTKVDRFNVYDATPFHRDPIREIADACKKHKMRLGFYYSQAQDWHHPGGSTCTEPWDRAQKGSMDEYVTKVAIPQVKEIFSNYGKISVLWWDTPWGMSKEKVDELAQLIKMQPGIITNDRLGGNIPGDVITPEQTLPPNGYGDRDWETCMTMNDTWGYKSYDNNWKSTQTHIRNIADCASKGGNYLLNVGPTSEGVFPQASLDVLKEIGAWMKTNGDSIYSTKASPFTTQLTWGRCTRKGQKLYLHVFDWPSDGVLRVPIANEVKKVYLLAQRRKALSVTKEEKALAILVPSKPLDPDDTVVVLEIIGEAKPTN